MPVAMVMAEEIRTEAVWSQYNSACIFASFKPKELSW